MPLISCLVNPILTRSTICVITNLTGAGKLAIGDITLYVSAVTLSTQDDAKPLHQLKSQLSVLNT